MKPGSVLGFFNPSTSKKREFILEPEEHAAALATLRRAPDSILKSRFKTLVLLSPYKTFFEIYRAMPEQEREEFINAIIKQKRE